MIDVLIVEDSPSAAQLLSFILTSDPGIRIAGVAASGADALRKLETMEIDVVTMDINLPGGMNGFETTRRIMETRPLPIAIISSLVVSSGDAYNPFRVMVEGALAVLAKPPGPGHPDFEKRSKELIRTVRAISEVKVVKRSAAPAKSVPHSSSSATNGRPAASNRVQPARTAQSAGRYRLLAIGASTGGPAVIESIFAALGPGFPLPILLVQHISAGFAEGFAAWLTKSTRLPTRVARQGELPEPGKAYVAPDDHHMGVSPSGAIDLNGAREPLHGLRPAAAHLFESVARMYGDRAIGVILTGMGADGSRELGLIKQAGGITIAQESESCVVDGMPGQAVKMGSASLVLTPEAISRKLCALAAE